MTTTANYSMGTPPSDYFAMSASEKNDYANEHMQAPWMTDTVRQEYRNALQTARLALPKLINDLVSVLNTKPSHKTISDLMDDFCSNHSKHLTQSWAMKCNLYAEATQALTEELLHSTDVIRNLAVYDAVCYLTDSYSRIAFLLAVAPDEDAMPEQISSYMKRLGQEWSSIDNIYAFREEIEQVLQTHQAYWKYLYSNEDWDAYCAMPEELTLFRATDALLDEQSREGLSWSLDKAVCLKHFAGDNPRYQQEVPVLLTLENYPKSHIVFYTNGRQEQEVIILDAFNYGIEIEEL